MDLFFCIWALFVHWIADFVVQSDDTAKRKSKSWAVLSKHIAQYAAVFFILYMGLAWWLKAPFVYSELAKWILVNSGLHFIIDAVTSRMTSYYWAEKRVHDFFVVIGLDQFLHTSILIYTLVLWC